MENTRFRPSSSTKETTDLWRTPRERETQEQAYSGTQKPYSREMEEEKRWRK